MTRRATESQIRDAFWKHVVRTESCWTWDGAVTGEGYGVISSKSSETGRMAHRLYWLIHNGPIPDGLCVLHKCDNPPCVNPEHLFLGTKKDNAIDMVKKGRRYVPHGECLSKLSEVQVREILDRFNSPSPPTKRGAAREYGIDDATLRSLLAGHTWKHVPRPAPEKGL